MSSTDSKMLGVVLLIRHGDRQSFYQNPDTYAPSNTALTPLGSQQEFQLGSNLRSVYLNEASPAHIEGINAALVDDAQIRVRADAGGEGGVIINSASALLQGLFPATGNSKTTLADGTNITAPLGGYQYIPVESVEPENDISLEGWTSCNTFNQATSMFYKSTAFKQMANDHDGFLKSLPAFLGGRPATLENMWNVYDFMNVQSIHNETFHKALPRGHLEHARYLADWHEYNIFSDPELTGIRNIAGQTIIPSILNSFKNIIDEADPVKLVYYAISYKPFISLFNMTGVVQASPQLAGVVDYASVVSFEVRQSASGDPLLRFKFMNGTGEELHTYPIFGSATDVPLREFMDRLEPLGMGSLSAWCDMCENSKDRGCAELGFAKAMENSHPTIESVGAGFLGAGLTLLASLVVVAALLFVGLLAWRPRRGRSRGGFDPKDVLDEA